MLWLLALALTLTLTLTPARRGFDDDDHIILQLCRHLGVLEFS
jgi:hypothetical protein